MTDDYTRGVADTLQKIARHFADVPFVRYELCKLFRERDDDDETVQLGTLPTEDERATAKMCKT
jgi:hypothetical protein